MSSGGLRHTIVLEKKRQAADLSGNGLATVFEPVGEVFAEIKTPGLGTYLDGVQIGERVTHRFRIRFRLRTDFNHISRGDQRFKVHRIGDPEGTRRYLWIDAEELNPGVDAL